MLEFDDLQHILITRVPALTGRYEFLSFRHGAQGRAWLEGILDQVASVQQARDSIGREQRWISVAFTWQGLRALGVDEQALATFPEEFRQGMVTRAEMLGDTGKNHPDRWVGSLARRAAACDERTPDVPSKDIGCRSAFGTGPGRLSAV